MSKDVLSSKKIQQKNICERCYCWMITAYYTVRLLNIVTHKRKATGDNGGLNPRLSSGPTTAYMMILH